METLLRPNAELEKERAAANWFCDGLPDVAFGLALSLAGGVGFARAAYFPSGWMRVAHLLATIPVLALFVWDRRIIGALKARVTSRRRGYEPDFERTPNAPWVYGNSVYILFMVPGFIDLLEDRSGLTIGMLAMAALVYVSRSRSDVPFSWWSVALLGLAGLPLSTLPVPLKAQQFLALLTAGVWLCCEGGYRLASYLRRHPPVTA